MLKWLWLAAVMVAMDQVTKQVASAYLGLHDPVPVVPMLNLTLMHNTGAAFSFLSEAGGWQRWFFVALALGVSAGIAVWLKRLSPGQTWLAVSLALVLGGAVGNLWDRVALGYVVDFIDVYYQQWHWPAFNVADIAISVGAAMLVIDSLRGERRSKPEAGRG